MSIRKTAIDWRLVKKEAEAIRLRTENQRLQALLRVNTEELEKCKIENKKQMDEHHLKALDMQSKTADLEDQINELKNNLSVLNIEKARSEETLRQEIEFNERKLTESQVNDVKMRSQIVDLEEEIKRIHLKNDQSTAELKHELQTLNNELESVRREKELYLSTVNEYKSKIQIINQLESKINELELKNRALENTIRDFKDGKSMSFILENELRELERLRIDNSNLIKENDELKTQIQSMSNVIDELNHQASSSSAHGSKKPAAKLQTEIYVEEISGSLSGACFSENLVQVEFDDEVSVSESMNNSELEIEPTDEMEPADSCDQGRPPQRRGRMNDPEGSIHSASDEESDKDCQEDPVEANEVVTSSSKRRERVSSDEESNRNDESSSSCDDDDDDEDDEEESGEDSDDSDIQEINE